MPQIGPFGGAIAAHDTSDVTPVTLRRWTPGTSDRGIIRDGSWAEVAVAAPYVVLPAKPTVRARRSGGTREVAAVGLICATRVQVAGDTLGKPDRLYHDGKAWIALDCRDWIPQAGYFAATFEQADEPEGEGALPP